jgi:hypothetical protein
MKYGFEGKYSYLLTRMKFSKNDILLADFLVLIDNHQQSDFRIDLAVLHIT